VSVLPDLSVIFVIFAVILLAVVLDRVLFKPLLRVMRERADAVSSAISLAETATARAQSATAEFDAKVASARADLYKQMDERRKAADGHRAELMARTKTEVDAQLADAKAALQAQADKARASLDQDAEALGQEIAAKVLGRN
jgi:F-type H+-transporting ATPase subunit b